jgi:hypothetical protein
VTNEDDEWSTHAQLESEARKSVDVVLLHSTCRRSFVSIAKDGSSFFFFPETDETE